VGSHKLPYKTLDDTKDIILVAGSQGAIEAHKKDMWDQVKANGLKKLAFAPKALIWHAKLIHGGKCLLWRCRKHGNGKGVLDGKNRSLHEVDLYSSCDGFVRFHLLRMKLRIQ
jgi:hypothetical protein